MKQWGLIYQGQLAPIARLDANDNVESIFVYGSRSNVPDYMTKAGRTYRFIVDARGSVRHVVDVTDDNVLQRLDYDEFGNVLGDTNPGFQPFGFAGGLYDVDTGFVRFGARDYDAGSGRWTAKDPILFRGGQTNLYLYVGGDPINQVDPSGLYTFVVEQGPSGSNLWDILRSASTTRSGASETTLLQVRRLMLTWSIQRLVETPRFTSSIRRPSRKRPSERIWTKRPSVRLKAS